jgi:hypothetical protein
MGILKTTRKFAVENSPAILTSLGVAGTVTTAVLTGRAVLYADRIVREESHAKHLGGLIPDDEKFTKREVVGLVWKEFVPPVLLGTATVIMIVGANHIGSRKAAAFAAAFKLSEEFASDYKKKVVETVGKKASEEIRSKVIAERMENNPGHETLIVAGSNSIFFDELSGRYFPSDYESVRKAVNDINHQINNSFFATVSDFYDRLEIDRTKMSDDFGWNADNQLEVTYTPIMMSAGKVAIALQYRMDPIHGYDRLR